jgi:hypothetical protein
MENGSNKFIRTKKENIVELLIVFLLIFFSTILYFSTLNDTPTYWFDEFMYVSRGWVMFQVLLGNASNETFYYSYIWFDHPNFGFFLLGFLGFLFPNLPWMQRARYIILLFCIIQNLFVYLIVKKYYSKRAGLIALILFGFNPGFIDLRKLVLLDNIGITFLLISIYFFYPVSFCSKRALNLNLIQDNQKKMFFSDYSKERSNLTPSIALSALTFGLSIITKYTFAIFVPGFVFFQIYYEKLNIISYDKNSIKNLLYFWIKWAIIAIIPFSAYIGYVFTQNYFDYFLFGIKWQMSRPITAGLSIDAVLLDWLDIFPVFCIMLLFLFFFSLILIFRSIFQMYYEKKMINIKFNLTKRTFFAFNKYKSDLLSIGGFSICLIIFLLRGRIIYFHYIIPLLSIGTIWIAILIDYIGLYFYEKFILSVKNEDYLNNIKVTNKKGQKSHKKFAAIIIAKFNDTCVKRKACVIIFIFLWLIPFRYPEKNSGCNLELQTALGWISDNLPRNSTILVEDFYLAELRDMGFLYVQLVHYFDVKFYEQYFRNDCDSGNPVNYQGELYLPFFYTDMPHNWSKIDYLILNSEQFRLKYWEVFNIPNDVIIINEFYAPLEDRRTIIYQIVK